MADKIRLILQNIKNKLQIPQINIATRREKVDQLVQRYAPATKVSEKVADIAEQLKYDTITKKVKEVVARYEKFTGVEEIMAIQNTVIDAQERFMAAQERRRDVGRELAILEARLKELHAEMQNTHKGEDKYLSMCTEEHKLIIQERGLRALFADAEREERELFATMSAAVKLGHERERAHAERNKYWYIVASIFGTVLGIGGSTINNHLKMAEFRDMMEQQMARSASVLYTMAGGPGGGASGADIKDAMKTEFAYQEQLAQSLRTMQDQISQLSNKQNSLIEHLHHREHSMDVHLRDLKRTIIVASQTSAASDAEITKALGVVHQDLEEVDQTKLQEVTNKVALEPNQILTGVGMIVCLAIIAGNIIGRIS